MSTQRYQTLDHSSVYATTLIVSFIVIAIASFAALNMEHEGHHITGMNNQIIWGMPHVLAIFLIVAASGALNVASIASVFDKDFYKPLAGLSAVVAVALLIGGLAVILLDLGRPDRLIIAMSYYNFRSIFAWNIILYCGFIGLSIVYLWTMLDWQMESFKRRVGIAAFCWRLVLTAGTGSIFGVLVAREAYHIAIMGPMFIVLSLGYGLALYLLILCLFLPDTQLRALLPRLSRLLSIFVLSGLAVSLIYHLSNWFWLEARDFELFLLTSQSVFPWLIWVVQFTFGTLVALMLLKSGRDNFSKFKIVLACFLVIFGGIAQLYSLIIGGQAYPMPLLEGYSASSNFYDGVVNSYTPSHWELMLGIGGFAIALLIITFALRLFRLIPDSK